MKHTIMSVCVCGLVLAAGAGCGKSDPVPRVSIAQGSWSVEVAETPRNRARGLSGRSSLPDGRGMLFVFGKSQVRQFWMRGCLIPLDVAFIDSDLRVVKIHTMSVEPAGPDMTRYSSDLPVSYGLEVPAGALDRAGVKAGDKVVFTGKIPSAS